MRNIQKVFTTILFLAGFAVPGRSQSDQNEEAVSMIRKLAETYKHAGNLSFDVSFKYASDQKPNIYLDSLGGSFKMNGSLYWYNLENTECIYDNHYLVMLFKEDKVMYITRPNSLINYSTPLALLDSMLNNRKDISCSIDRNPTFMVITILFPGGSSYKKIEYTIDAKTGYLNSTKTWVRSAELYDPSVKNLVDKNAYAIIRTSYSHYRKEEFNKNVFDLARYFRKEGSQMTCVAPFESYKIFVATPNL